MSFFSFGYKKPRYSGNSNDRFLGKCHIVWFPERAWNCTNVVLYLLGPHTFLACLCCHQNVGHNRKVNASTLSDVLYIVCLSDVGFFFRLTIVLYVSTVDRVQWLCNRKCTIMSEHRNSVFELLTWNDSESFSAKISLIQFKQVFWMYGLTVYVLSCESILLKKYIERYFFYPPEKNRK